MTVYTLVVDGETIPIERIRTEEAHPTQDPDKWEATIKPDVGVALSGDGSDDEIEIKRDGTTYFKGLLERVGKEYGRERGRTIGGRHTKVKLWRKWNERNEDPKIGGFWKHYYAHKVAEFYVHTCESDDVSVGVQHRWGWGIKPDNWVCSAIASEAGSSVDYVKDRLNIATWWSRGTNQAVDDWFKIDLGASYTVAGVRVENRRNDEYIRYYKIQTSTDDAIYNDRASGTNGLTLDYCNIVESWTPVTARYIKILCTGAYAKDWTITQVYVYKSTGGDITGISIGTFDTSAILTDKALDFIPARRSETLHKLSQEVHTANVPWEFWVDNDGVCNFKARRGSDLSATINFRYSSELASVKNEISRLKRADRVKILGKGQGHGQDLVSSAWVGSGEYELITSDKTCENKAQADERAAIVQNEQGSDEQSIKVRIEVDPYATNAWGVGDDITLTDIVTDLSSGFRVKKVIREWTPEKGEVITIEASTRFSDVLENIKKVKHNLDIINRGGDSELDNFMAANYPYELDGGEVADDSLDALSMSQGVQPFGTDIAFSPKVADEHDSLTYTSGTIEFADGDTLSITGADFDNLSQGYHYIYFTIGSSALSESTLYSDTVGNDKGLICIVYVSADADQHILIQPFRSKGLNIIADVIAANAIATINLQAESVTAAKIATDAVTLETSIKDMLIHFRMDNLRETQPSLTDGGSTGNAHCIYEDTEGFWTQAANVTLSEDTSLEKKGSSCLKIVSASRAADLIFSHDYGSGTDLSGFEYVSVWWYGAEQNGTVKIRFTDTGGNYSEYHWTDDYNGWGRHNLAIDDPDATSGTLDWSIVRYIYFYETTQNDATWYLDRTILDIMKIVDRSGEENNGFGYGAPKEVTGRFGGGMDFDGSDDYFEVLDALDLKFRGDFTVMMWIYRDVDSGAIEALLAKSDNTNYDYWLTITAGDVIEVGFTASDSSANYLTGTETITTGAWHQVVGVFIEGDKFYIYVDGDLDTSGITSGSIDKIPRASSRNVWLGRRAAVYNFDGKMDEVRIWTRGLLAAEVKAEFRAGSIIHEGVTITKDMISLVSVDQNGKLKLSEIGSGDLDNISDGSTYSRVLTTDIQAGHIKLSETIGDLDDISDGTTWGRVAVTDITAGHIILSTCSGDLDDIDQGTNYKKVAAAHISGDGVIKLISATVKDSEWYDESGVEIDATHGINIYGTDNALTTRATKAGAIQCSVNASGQITAGSGALVLDANGMTITGNSTFIYFYDGTVDLKAYLYASNALDAFVISGDGTSHIRFVIGDVYIQDDLRVNSDSNSYIIFEEYGVAPSAYTQMRPSASAGTCKVGTSAKPFYQMHSLEFYGYPMITTTTGKPAAGATYLGRLLVERSGAGNKSYVYICVLNDADGYEWVQLGIST